LKSLEVLLEEMLAGNRRALARLITQVENATPIGNAALRHLYSRTGHAYTVGITGAPGTGKSSLVNSLTKALRKQGHTVGIVAVDPTSPFSGGAVLGDRFRMNDLAGDKGVFIRSMATRGNLGGLARTTYDVIRVLDAAGFDYILVETVGAGQSEVDIAQAAQTTIVVEAPGLGDDIQAIKAGILEIADILIVNKADRPGVQNTVRALRAMLDLGHRQRMVAHHGEWLLQDDGPANPTPEYDFWEVPIIQTVALEEKGMPEVLTAITNHAHYLRQTGMDAERQRLRLQKELVERLKTALFQQLVASRTPALMEDTLDKIVAREIDPATAVRALMDGQQS
jgi:LAO/AO transport system kinase